jgi:diguanylate cyclase (GGDEF)-like protein
MICNEAFSRFIQLLSAEANTLAISQQAFALVGDSYHIAEVRFQFQVESTGFTPGGDQADGVLYRGAGYDRENAEPDYVKTFHTGENGVLQLLLVNQLPGREWNKQELEDLDAILEVFFLHMGRYRLTMQARKNALTDFLTGLPNADGYMRYAIGLFQQKKLAEYNAYYFNLKGFGLVNRRFGQKETDEILKRYARVLMQYTNGQEIIGRLGGDNFVALIRRERTEEFLKLLSGVTVYGEQSGEQIPVVIGAVAGVFEIEPDISDCEPLLSKSGEALNVAKNIAKKPYVFASRKIEKQMYEQKHIAAIFPEALKNNEFVVYYQPKVDTQSYTIAGAEALVRWNREGQIVKPGSFIPVLEKNGSICQLDFYMLEQVCRDILHWQEQGIAPVRISVNFSRRHLDNPRLAEDIIDVIQRYQVPIQYIEIEVTETVDEAEQDRLSEFIRKMREASIATAIDDFGTGYSSLDLLRSVPIDVLKIDKSFIDDEEITESDSIVLSNIIKMARQLRMEVITEGVETWRQVKFLQDMECNLMQGYLFDRPMPEAEFEEKMKQPRYDIARLDDFCDQE